jgi:hypothetical protein
MPSQFLAAGAKGATAERALMLAVLEDAIRLVLKDRDGETASTRREREAARAWIDSTDRRWPFSFENICDVLGIDETSMRAALAAPDRDVASKIPPHATAD